MSTLASAFWKQGWLKKAEELEVQVMETRMRLLGQQHPETLESMANLACIWKSQCRDEEAIGLIMQAHKIQRARTGADHPHTIAWAQTLRQWLTDLGSAENTFEDLSAASCQMCDILEEVD
jgi:hypothetical protein